MNHNVSNELPDVSKGVKILCLLSFFGFIYAIIVDASNYFQYAHFDKIEGVALENLEDAFDTMKSHGVDLSPEAIKILGKTFFYRSVLDIIVLLGVTLMYFRIKAGFWVYAVFQIFYVATPLLLIGATSKYIPGLQLSTAAISLVYIALFLTQKNKL